MRRHGIGTGRLRRRLTIAFVIVAAISAGLLALGSFLLVREARLRDSVDQAGREARADLRAIGPAPEDPNDTQNLLRGLESTGLHAVLVRQGRSEPSNTSFDPPIPAELRARVARGQIGWSRIADGGHHELLIGSRLPGSEDELYLIFLEDRIQRELGQLGLVLLVGWALVVIVAGLIGRGLARRTLDPVAQASAAARSMAQGLLATRLPVEGKDEFARWASSFNDMADALETKINALSEAQARERRFTSDVAHELRTPVTALVGEASLLRDHVERMPPEARRPAELLIQDVARLRKLVDDLMEISRFDAGRESVTIEQVDLAALVGASLRLRGWEGTVTVTGGSVVVSSDRRRLERVVANLVGNALEHGGRDVRVTLGRDGQQAFVEVDDRGRGIPPDRLPHLFERFYKGDSSRTSPGSGLGLAIARENARLLGGDINVWSEVGVGTRFTARFPLSGPSLSGKRDIDAAPGPVGQPLHGGDGRVTAPEDAEDWTTRKE